MSAGRVRRSLADLQAEHAAQTPAPRTGRTPARLDDLSDGGTFLPPHRSLRDGTRPREDDQR